jgi:hypothetical protein
MSHASRQAKHVHNMRSAHSWCRLQPVHAPWVGHPTLDAHRAVHSTRWQWQLQARDIGLLAASLHSGPTDSQRVMPPPVQQQAGAPNRPLHCCGLLQIRPPHRCMLGYQQRVSQTTHTHMMAASRPPTPPPYRPTCCLTVLLPSHRLAADAYLGYICRAVGAYIPLFVQQHSTPPLAWQQANVLPPQHCLPPKGNRQG